MLCIYCPCRPRRPVERNLACRVCWNALEGMREVIGAAAAEWTAMRNAGVAVAGHAERVERYAAIVAGGGRIFE